MISLWSIVNGPATSAVKANQYINVFIHGIKENESRQARNDMKASQQTQGLKYLLFMNDQNYAEHWYYFLNIWCDMEITVPYYWDSGNCILITLKILTVS